MANGHFFEKKLLLLVKFNRNHRIVTKILHENYEFQHIIIVVLGKGLITESSEPYGKDLSYVIRQSNEPTKLRSVSIPFLFPFTIYKMLCLFLAEHVCL